MIAKFIYLQISYIIIINKFNINIEILMLINTSINVQSPKTAMLQEYAS